MSPELGQEPRSSADPRRIALLAACDRFNYGDLLFPIVVERALRQYGCQLPVTCCATVKADLRRCGGQHTQPIAHIFKPGVLPNDSVVIVAGGEVLDALWTPTLETLLPAPLAFIIRRVRNRLGERRSDALCRWLSGTRLDFPWVLSPADFSTRVRVAYNCVGGSRVGAMPPELRSRVLEKLAWADYLSVRDARSVAELKAGGLGERVRLAPDCAVLISRFFPPNRLAELVSAPAQGVVRRFPDGYLCFQINKNEGCGRAPVIAAELDAIARRHGLGIVLLPNGRARNHEDQVALAEIRQLLGQSALLVGGEPTVHDIMFLIGSARVYAGTSLHGSITALAYAVAHLGLTHNIPKLDAFLHTWDIPEQQGCVPLEELSGRVDEVLCVSRAALERKRDELIRTSLANFADLFAATGIEGSFGDDAAAPAHEDEGSRAVEVNR